MIESDQKIDAQTGENEARDKAITAFVTLSERLKSYYNRENNIKNESNKPIHETDSSVGASTLFNTIEGEIIPRLMIAHSINVPGVKQVESADQTLSAEEHEKFLELVMEDSASAAHEFVDALLKRGIARETLFLELLGTAARRLGVLWEEDVADFTEVTIGLCRLHEILRKNSILYNDLNYRKRPTGNESRILLSTACGDQHVFGVVMVAEFFRLAGWHVWSEPGASSDQLAEILSAGTFDIVGLSAANSVLTDDIAQEIRALRIASANSALKVMVGGRLFAETPDLVSKVGADAAASDAQSAPEVAKGLLAVNRLDA